MKQLKRIPVVVLLVVCFLCFAYPNAGRAAAMVTDSAIFNAQLAPGYYLENFAGLPTLTPTALPSTLLFTGGAGDAFSYNVVDRGSSGLYALPTDETGNEVTTFANGFTLGFDFLSNNVTAFGGYFFSADGSGAPDGGTITLLLSDGTSTTITNGSLTSFLGFLSPGLFITRLDITPAFGSYATVANFEVGTVAESGVPEPATFGLLAAGLIAGGLLGKRMAGHEDRTGANRAFGEQVFREQTLS